LQDELSNLAGRLFSVKDLNYKIKFSKILKIIEILIQIFRMY